MLKRPPLPFIFTVTLTGILSNTLVTPAIPDILDEFGVGAGEAGLLVAAGSVAGVVVAPVAGVLADRFGRRVILTASLVVFGTFGGLAALSPTFEILLLARFLQGTGSAGLVNLAVVLIGDHWSGLDRTRLVGRNTAVLTVGLAAIPLVSGLVTQAAGWRVTFALYTIALGTAGVAWAVLDGRRPVAQPPLRAQLGQAVVVVRQPLVLATIVGSFLAFTLIFAVFLTVFPVHLAQRFGLEAGMRGVMISIPALTSTLAAYNLGRIRAATSARRTVILASVGMAVAFLFIGLTGSLLVAGAAALLYGASSGSLVPTLQDLNISGSPDEHRAAVVAVFVSAARLGQTVGPLLAGLVVGLLGTGATIATGSAAALLLLALGVWGPFPRIAEATMTTRG